MAFVKRAFGNTQYLFKNRIFGLYSNVNYCKNGIYLIGVGGNLGDSKRLFLKLIIKLNRDGLVKVTNVAPIYKNPPFGYLEQSYFFNTLFLISSSLKPIELLIYLQKVEKHFGRKRLFKDGPRTLDLDIILYNKLYINKSDVLNIPHPKWQSRDSVLVPLRYLKESKCLQRVLSHKHLKMLTS